VNKKKTKYSFGAAISCSPEQGLCNRRNCSIWNVSYA